MIEVRDSHGAVLKYINVRVSKGQGGSDAAIDDRFTDLAGHTAWPGGFVGDCSASPDGWTLHVNDRNVNPAYGDAHLHVSSLDAAPIAVTLSNTGGGGGTQPTEPVGSPAWYEAWHQAFLAEAARLGVSTNSVETRRVFLPWMNANSHKWQNQDRALSHVPPDYADMRARIFLAPGADQFLHTVDTGDDGGPFKWIIR